MTADGGTGMSGLLCGTAAMLVLAALSSAPPAAAAASYEVFAPPSAQLVLTRTMLRPLPDGKAVTTRRSYQVRIVPVGSGYRVEGSLLAVNVDAPPSLAALAEIERHRPDEGMFPVMLDAHGIIVASGAVQAGGALEQAAAIAASRIGNSQLAVRDEISAQSFITQLRARAPRSQWPDDIFHPVPGRRTEQRVISLPGGGEGKVTIEIAASGQANDAQLASLERVITTDLAGERRVTRETWELTRYEAVAER